MEYSLYSSCTKIYLFIQPFCSTTGRRSLLSLSMHLCPVQSDTIFHLDTFSEVFLHIFSSLALQCSSLPIQWSVFYFTTCLAHNFCCAMCGIMSVTLVIFLSNEIASILLSIYLWDIFSLFAYFLVRANVVSCHWYTYFDFYYYKLV